MLVITFGFILRGGWYVNGICGELMDALEQMPAAAEADMEEFSAAYNRFRGVWKGGEMWLHILVGHDMADRVEELLEEMGMRYIGRDEAGYLTARELLVLQLKKIREGERVAVDSIL